MTFDSEKIKTVNIIVQRCFQNRPLGIAIFCLIVVSGNIQGLRLAFIFPKIKVPMFFQMSMQNQGTLLFYIVVIGYAPFAKAVFLLQACNYFNRIIRVFSLLTN